MSANWKYMVEFLSDKTKPLVNDDSDITDIHCKYVESLLLPTASIVHRGQVHRSNKAVDLSSGK